MLVNLIFSISKQRGSISGIDSGIVIAVISNKHLCKYHAPYPKTLILVKEQRR